MVESAADENGVSIFGLGKSGEMSPTLSQRNHVRLTHQTLLSNIRCKNHDSTGDAGHAAPFQSSWTSPDRLDSTPAFTHTPGAQSAVSHSVLLKFLLFSSLQTCATYPLGNEDMLIDFCLYLTNLLY